MSYKKWLNKKYRVLSVINSRESLYYPQYKRFFGWYCMYNNSRGIDGGWVSIKQICHSKEEAENYISNYLSNLKNSIKIKKETKKKATPYVKSNT
jgi:hypothetical protein